MLCQFSCRTRWWKNVPIVVGLSVLLLNAPATVQVGGANVGGVVTDGSGAVLPGVTITITNTANGRAQSLVTSEVGRYRAVALQAVGGTPRVLTDTGGGSAFGGTRPLD